MAIRGLIDRDDSTNGTVKHDYVSLIRSSGGTIVTFQFSLRGAIAGVNTLTVNLYQVVNPLAAVADRIYAQERNPQLWVPLVITETEASGNLTTNVKLPNAYEAITLEFVRAGAGTNTFRTRAFFAP